MKICIASVETMQNSVKPSSFSKKLIALDQLVTLSEDLTPSKSWFIEGQKYNGLIVRLSYGQFDGLSLPILLHGVTDRKAPASGLAAKVPTGHVAHSRDSDQITTRDRDRDHSTSLLGI